MKKFRSYPIRCCFNLIWQSLLSLIGGFIIIYLFSPIPDRPEVLWQGFAITATVFCLIVVSVCIFINKFMKRRVYHINYYEKFLRKGKKIIYYEYVAEVKFRKTITHRIFGLVTIKVKSPYGSLVLRDVPEKIEDYIRGKY